MIIGSYQTSISKDVKSSLGCRPKIPGSLLSVVTNSFNMIGDALSSCILRSNTAGHPSARMFDTIHVQAGDADTSLLAYKARFSRPPKINHEQGRLEKVASSLYCNLIVIYSLSSSWTAINIPTTRVSWNSTSSTPKVIPFPTTQQEAK